MSSKHWVFNGPFWPNGQLIDALQEPSPTVVGDGLLVISKGSLSIVLRLGLENSGQS